MTAKEARVLMDEYAKKVLEKDQTAYQDIIRKIKSAINDSGASSLTYYGHMSKSLSDFLCSPEQGYKITEYVDNDPRDRSTYYIIKW